MTLVTLWDIDVCYLVELYRWGNFAIESKPQRFQPSWPETFLFRQIFLACRYYLIFSLFLKLLLSLLNQFFSPILSRGLSNSLPFFWGFSAFFYPFQWLIQGRGPEGPPASPLFLEQTEGWRAEQIFFWDCGNCVTVYFTSLWYCCYCSCCCFCCWCCS